MSVLHSVKCASLLSNKSYEKPEIFAGSKSVEIELDGSQLWEPLCHFRKFLGYQIDCITGKNYDHKNETFHLIHL